MSVLGHRLRAYVRPSGSLLLDTYGSATAAYSVRKLRTGYAGNCVRVQRSSDSTEQNIGFDGAGYLDTASMLTFAGAGDCGAVTWYDQSGNGYDLTTSNRNVAKLVVAGVLQTHNSVATCKFTSQGLIQHVAGSNIWTASTACASAVAAIGSGSTAYGRVVSTSRPGANDYDSTTGVLVARNNGAQGAVGYRGAGLANQAITYDQLHVMQSNFSGTQHVMTVDGTNSSPVANSTAFTVTTINVGDGVHATVRDYLTGSISELVLWPTDQASNIAGIRTSQKNYFGTA